MVTAGVNGWKVVNLLHIAHLNVWNVIQQEYAFSVMTVFG